MNRYQHMKIKIKKNDKMYNNYVIVNKNETMCSVVHIFYLKILVFLSGLKMNLKLFIIDQPEANFRLFVC